MSITAGLGRDDSRDSARQKGKPKAAEANATGEPRNTKRKYRQEAQEAERAADEGEKLEKHGDS